MASEIIATLIEHYPDKALSWGFLILLVLSVGLSLLAGYLLEQTLKNRIPATDTPTTLSARGSYIPIILGTRRVGSIFAWAGGRRRTSGPRPVYLENGWHILCVGPASALTKIWVGGIPILDTRITPQTHPSGSNINLGRNGDFDIFWGDEFQPINIFLGDPDRIGIQSRWPLVTYVVWREKNLKFAPQWPVIDYEIEVRPQQTTIPLATSPPWLETVPGGIPALSGANPAHCLEQLIFAQAPYGCGRNRNDFNMQSLYDIAATVDGGAEFLPANILIQSGEDLRSAIGNILQDLGIFIAFNTVTGLFDFKLIRVPLGTVPQITQDLLLPPAPETVTNHFDPPTNKVILAFSDKERAFRDSTISINDDGQATLTNSTKGRSVRSVIATDFQTAGKIALRREQDDQFEPASWKIHTGRAARKFSPGDPLHLVGVPNRLRIINVITDPLTSETILECLLDTYGVIANTADVTGGGGTQIPPLPIAPDIASVFIEIPPYASKELEIGVLRTKGTTGVGETAIWLSADGAAYTAVGTTFQSHLCADIAEPFPAGVGGSLIGGHTVVEDGPLCDLIAGDLTSIPDLTGDPVSWRLGKLLAIIFTGVNEEICFIRNIQVLSSAQFRLRGILRARYGGDKFSHGAGSRVFILPADNLIRVTNSLIKLNRQLYLKTQPLGPTLDVDLSEVTPYNKLITGKVDRALTPKNLVTSNLTNTFLTGEAITFKWDYYSTAQPDTGAGAMAAGNGTQASPVQGSFTLQLLTTGLVLKHQVIQVGNSYTISNAALVTAFTSEPSSFIVKLTHTKNGLISGVKQITVIRL